MPGLPYFLAAAVLVAAVAALFDWRTGEIPNGLTLGSLVAAPLAHALLGARTGDAPFEAGLSILGAVLCSIVPWGLFKGGAIGGGDVKLFAALGALLGPLNGLEAQLHACIVSAILALGMMAWQGKLFRVLGNTLALALNPFLPRDKRREIRPEMLTWVKFGPAIFVGTALTAFLHWRAP